MKRGLIVTGGKIDLEFAGQYLKMHSFDCVVSVDGGLKYTKELGVMPNAIVGDFDTIHKEILDEYRKIPSILWDVHKPEKDETDTELAINTAIKLGCDDLVILGATGGRLDHEWSNVHLLKTCLDQNVDACLLDRQNKVFLIAPPGREFDQKNAFGKYISFIPMTSQVKGITLEGFKYLLKDKSFSIGLEAGRMISNEMAEEHAKLYFREGILICMETRD